LIIEIDGNQHFKQVSNWQSAEETQIIDVHKMKLANERNYSVIRIYQPDIWHDKNNWQKKLKKVIKQYDDAINIYIGDIYLLHSKYKLNYNFECTKCDSYCECESNETIISETKNEISFYY
jgi:hypothetical protein